MEFLKKNALAILALVLCAGLFVVTAAQKNMISALQAELETSQQEADTMSNRLERAEKRLETLQTAQNAEPPSASFANVSVNTMDRMLTFDIYAEIPNCTEYSVSVGFCYAGDPYRAAWQITYLHREEDGSYTGTVTIPFVEGIGIELRTEDEIVLYSSDTMLTLLPLQIGYGGTSLHYNSTAQVFSQCDWTADLTDPQGKEVQATDGEFRVYRNGKLVFAGKDDLDSYAVEVDGERMDSVGVDCAPGDHIRLCYACTDSFGLRYEFPLSEWVAQRWDDAERYPLSSRPIVIWPE